MIVFIVKQPSVSFVTFSSFFSFWRISGDTYLLYAKLFSIA